MKTAIPGTTIVILLSFAVTNGSSQERNRGKDEPRVHPLPVSEMLPDWVKILERLPGNALKGKYSPVNVFGTLMQSPATMGSFLDFWVTSKLKMGLTGREQELVILRMGYLYQCDYVWKHHIPAAREYGASEQEISGLKTGQVPALFSGKEMALLMLTDEMVKHRTIREETWLKWHNDLTDSDLVELISLVSQYTFFSLLNNGLNVQVEEPLKDIPGLHPGR